MTVVLDKTLGRASGVGSWPGTSPIEAARTTFGELGEPPHVPYLPELPARGPGADLVGRSAGLLVDLHVDLQPSGWRLVDRPGRDAERTHSWLRQDLDVLAEVAEGYEGPLKVQVAGPWTLAAALWLPRLERAVVDSGACRDLTDSLAEGVARHVAQVAALVPRAQIVFQVDEPSLPAVLSGRLPTASGFGRLRAVEENPAVAGLSAIVSAARQAGAISTLVHCCAGEVPVSALARTGADGLSLDVALLDSPGWEAVAAAVEGGMALWAGVVPTARPSRPVGAAAGAADSPGALATSLWGAWRRLGLGLAHAGGIVVTPSCGLARSTPAQARAALRGCKQVAAALSDLATA